MLHLCSNHHQGWNSLLGEGPALSFGYCLIYAFSGTEMVFIRLNRFFPLDEFNLKNLNSVFNDKKCIIK